MNSFYGGKKGAPFIIVCSYPTVAAMAADFSKGLGNTAVQFDEYVIINTVNKNDPDNGRIYRRGYNLEATEEEPRWTENGKAPMRSTGGGEYVGTIVGPAGRAPQFIFTTMAEVDEQIKKWPEGTWEVRKGNGSYGPIDMNIIPGYTGAHPTSTNTPPDFSNNKKFNDNILWNYISIRDKNNSDTTVYMGFKIPYTVFSYTAKSVSPYYNRSNNTANFINNNLIDRQKVSEQHPFYEYWDLKIPKGIKGDSFKNFRLINANPSDNIQSYAGQSEDRVIQTGEGRDKETRKILVYDYYHYDKEEGGEPVSLYLGDYNMIKSIYLDDDGTFEINYTHDDASRWPKKIDWIKQVALNSETGYFKVTYNNNTVTGANTDNNTAYSTTLRWVKGATIEDNGSLTLHYTTGNDTNDGVKKLKWITGITLSAGGTLTIKYNNGTSDTVFSNVIKWITGVELADNGTLKVSYNNGEQASVFDKKIKWITNADLDPDGTLTFSYNNGASPTRFSKAITRVQTATFSNTGKFLMTFNNDTIPNIEQNIQWVNKMSVNPTNAMLSATYNTGEVVELGAVRDYSGWLNGLILDASKNSQLMSDEDAKSYLDEHYPNGLTGVNLATKTVAIQRPGGLRTVIFAFDYNSSNARKWQPLGYLETDAPQFICGKDESYNLTLDAKKKELQVGGIWFVEEDT